MSCCVRSSTRGFILATVSPIRADNRNILCAYTYLFPSLSHRLRDHVDIIFVRRNGFLHMAHQAAQGRAVRPRRTGWLGNVCMPSIQSDLNALTTRQR